jgi:hypothetical protein
LRCGRSEQSGPNAVVERGRGEVRRERNRVVSVAQQPCRPAHLGDAAAVAGGDRHAHLHGVEQREAEPLVERRVGQHGGISEQPRSCRFVDTSSHDHTSGGRGVEGIDRAVDGLPVVAIGSGENQQDLIVFAGQRPERFDEDGQVLASLDVPIAAMNGRRPERNRWV